MSLLDAEKLALSCLKQVMEEKVKINSYLENVFWGIVIYRSAKIILSL